MHNHAMHRIGKIRLLPPGDGYVMQIFGDNLSRERKIMRGWMLFRSFRAVAFISFAWVPILPILGTILKIYPPSIMYSFGRAVFVISILLFCFAVLWTTFWPCPRCRRPYALGRGTNFPFLKKCRHCGLPFGVIKIDSDAQQGNPADAE